jgi:16S rRNA (cytosine1402-N4)-methyltransferase
VSKHIPVMADEVIEYLRPQPGQVLVDGTLGGGGHTERLAAEIAAEGLVIALDRDPTAVTAGCSRFGDQRVECIHADYRDLPEVLRSLGISSVDGILLDLGLSRVQFADDERGFSFNSPGPLDLRFDTTRGQPTWRLLERLSEKHLADILYQYGQERYSRRIARRIVARRRSAPLRQASELAQLVRATIPRQRSGQRTIDPATRTFQALRIAANDELESLSGALGRLADCLRSGARLAIISYHSLEDRLVKQAFRDDLRYAPLLRRPIRPDSTEVTRNVRSRSARLRVAERTCETICGGKRRAGF